MSSHLRRSPSSILGTVLRVLFLALLFLFLYSPLLVTVLYSFNSSKVQTFPMAGFSTEWYTALFSDPQMLGAIAYSFQVALTSVAVSAIAGLAFAMILNRARFRGIGSLDLMIASPLVTPGMVLGISFLIVFSVMRVNTGFWTIVIGHAAFITPLIVYILQQRLKTLDPSLEQASMDLGAGPIRTFWHVVLPGVRVALVAGCLIGFTMSMDEIAVTFFLAGTKPTLPVYVWGLVRFGFTPEVNAAFALIGGVTLVLIGIAGLLIIVQSRRQRVNSVDVGDVDQDEVTGLEMDLIAELGDPADQPALGGMGTRPR